MIEPAFLLDSNICIYILSDGDCAAAQRLRRCELGTVAVSAITYGELAIGFRRRAAAHLASLDKLVATMTVLPFDQQAARAYADIPFKRGTFDRLIAAHALALGATLITNNEADFADVPGLKVENWTAPI